MKGSNGGGRNGALMCSFGRGLRLGRDGTMPTWGGRRDCDFGPLESESLGSSFVLAGIIMS
jgi:hypothetical protein